MAMNLERPICLFHNHLLFLFFRVHLTGGPEGHYAMRFSRGEEVPVACFQGFKVGQLKLLLFSEFSPSLASHGAWGRLLFFFLFRGCFVLSPGL